MRSISRALAALAALLVVYGAVLVVAVLGWAAPLAQALPSLRQLGITAPLMTLCAGLALLGTARLPSIPVPAWLTRASLGALVLVPVGVLIAYAADMLGLLGEARPSPFRMAPNSALAFLCVGLALWLAQRPATLYRRAYLACAVTATALTLSALAGYFLNLEALYRIGDMNRMLMPTSLALGLASMALWTLYDALAPLAPWAVDAHGSRIQRRAVMVLSLVAVSAGIGGFALLRDAFESSLANSMLLTARTHATTISNSLHDRLWFPRTFTNRPDVTQALASLASDPAAREPLVTLQAVAAGFLTAGIDGVRFLSPARATLTERGSFDGDRASAIDTLEAPGQQAQLRWRDGYVLHTETPVESAGQVVGHVVTQQRLRVLDQMLQDLRSSNDSADALVCGRHGGDAHCAPTRLYAQPFRIPMLNPAGEVNMPINRALLGEAGVTTTTDLRGVRVVAAYTPLGDYGLGLVVKSDVATLYAPLKQRLAALVGLLLVLVGLGVWALGLRVRPMLNQVLREQARTRLILEKSNDAFIGLDAEGRVTDWNPAAAHLFGVPATQALGQPVAALIRPASADDQEAVAVLASLANPAHRLVEITVQGAAGRALSLELSLSKVKPGRSHAVYVFARDLSERRETEEQLRQSEHSLRTITANVPALISRIRADGTILFANPHCAEVYGLAPAQLVGRTLLDIRGEDAFRQLQPHMARVLQGEAVMFESTSTIHGAVRHFKQSYVPDLDGAGRVQGFYSVSVDITDIKGNEKRLTASEKRLRDITDNLPVLISYIDPSHRVQFINATGRDWLGLEPSTAIGQDLASLIGRDLYGSRAGHLNQALQGQRVRFEMDARVRGQPKVLQTDYVPDVTHDGEVAGVYGISSDVTVLKDTERRLTELLDHDTLTGLANRRCFNRKLPEALARARRSGAAMGLFYLDVDRFKQINDQHGHAVGDQVLIEFARRLVQAVRATDTVVRLAGDEFVVLLEGLQHIDEASHVARKILARMGQAFDCNGLALDVSTSIGIAMHDAGSGEVAAETLLSLADEALYEAKQAGRGCVRVHPESSKSAARP